MVASKKVEFRDFNRKLFVNRSNGQVSLTLPKKDLKVFFGKDVIPNKVKLRLWKGGK